MSIGLRPSVSTPQSVTVAAPSPHLAIPQHCEDGYRPVSHKSKGVTLPQDQLPDWAPGPGEYWAAAVGVHSPIGPRDGATQAPCHPEFLKIRTGRPW